MKKVIDRGKRSKTLSEVKASRKLRCASQVRICKSSTYIHKKNTYFAFTDLEKVFDYVMYLPST